MLHLIKPGLASRQEPESMRKVLQMLSPALHRTAADRMAARPGRKAAKVAGCRAARRAAAGTCGLMAAKAARCRTARRTAAMARCRASQKAARCRVAPRAALRETDSPIYRKCPRARTMYNQIQPKKIPIRHVRRPVEVISDSFPVKNGS